LPYVFPQLQDYRIPRISRVPVKTLRIVILFATNLLGWVSRNTLLQWHTSWRGIEYECDRTEVSLNPLTKIIWSSDFQVITSAKCQHAQKTNEAPHSDWHCWLTWKWFVIIYLVSYLYNTRNNTNVTLGVNDCPETKLGSSGYLKHRMNRSSRRVGWKGIIFIVDTNNFFEHATWFSLMHIEFYNYVCPTGLVVTLCGLL